MKSLSASILITLLCCVKAIAQPAPASPEWGTILGRVVYDGPVPEAKMLKIPAGRSPVPVPDETLVVGPNGGLANVIVYLQNSPTKTHAGYLELKSQKRTIIGKSYRFEPHVLALWTNDELELLNVDSERGQNIAYDSSKQGFNVVLAMGKPHSKKLLVGENQPSVFSSSIHPWMRGHLLVRDNPYFCVTDERGIFCIPNLPTNEDLKFVFWHERLGILKNVTNDNYQNAIRGDGKLQLQLKTDVRDLGEYKIDPKLFKE